jgi:hypothetical protein
VGEAYEYALCDWGLTPEYINENWTEEKFGLLMRKLGNRRRDDVRLRAALAGAKMRDEGDLLSNKDFFRKHGIIPQRGGPGARGQRR